MRKIITEGQIFDEADPSPESISLKHQLRDALNQNQSLKGRVGDDLALFDYIKKEIQALPPYKRLPNFNPKNSGHAEHQAVFIVTDAHSEEAVKSEEMEGAASYDFQTFENRMDASTDKVVEITTMMRQSVPVTECHVFYLGDWFLGQIHPVEHGFGTSKTLPLALPSAAKKVADQVMKLSAHFDKVHVWGFCGNHGRNCYDSETEILTSKGWKKIDQVDRDSEEVAVYVPEQDSIRYEVPKSWYLADYTGEMVSIKSKGVDLLVTPEHKLWLKAPSSTVHGKRYKYGFSKRLAGERTWSDGWTAQCGITNWEGKTPKVVVPPSAKCAGFDIEPSESWAKFFGWYVSEGCCGKNDRRISISQSKSIHPEYHDIIIKAIENLGFKPSIRDEMIRFGSVVLCNFLATEFGSVSREKKIPVWLKNWPKELLESFLETAMKGDGCWGDKRSKNSTAGQYTSTSDRLIDDMQEICFKLGYSTKACPRYPSRYKGTDYVGTARKLLIVKRPYRSISQSTKKLYSGTIWCPTVSTGWVVVRRNGKCVISGNTEKPVTKMMADRNWDMSVYLIAQMFSRAQTNVEWNIPQSIMDVAHVMGWGVLLTHGNCVKRSGPEPLFAISRMVDMEHRQRRKTDRDFDYAFVGHWHDDSMLHGECVLCPPMIGSSQFSRYLMHQSTPPGALLYFFTEKHGRTSSWRLNL